MRQAGPSLILGILPLAVCSQMVNHLELRDQENFGSKIAVDNQDSPLWFHLHTYPKKKQPQKAAFFLIIVP